MSKHTGQVALITGAAGGIGSAVATALHRRGASIVLVDMASTDLESVAAKLGNQRAAIAYADVTVREQLDAAVATAIDTFGKLDVVMANAGISSGAQASTVRSIEDGVFERVIGVNLIGVWNTVRAALPHIVESGGYVLLTSSTYAYLNGLANAPYAASKAAVEQLGRALRTELAGTKATAGVLYPGWVATPIAEVAFGGDDVATAMTARAFPTPLLRPITPDKLARVAVRGIARRAPRIAVPGRWIPISILRGIVNPIMDAAMERDAELIRLTAELDARRS
ncbi:SDR family NAD(P)-dependent oxidoreductase [Rhodococcus ruber]|uniref:SDR family NAD(P)-dependent oxidoreductase n=1 Tax=Rhodococcus ruber TaxID=1830 RepID=A0ABT4MBB2_9NOCA|nr:SDR family NAD(P)-dependent oxidoreductase [Rhodococcus ruber]MCZ4518261.1 SDR family NAD(P)-dependent oxidoreductase [Rhodococcus ruber]